MIHFLFRYFRICIVVFTFIACSTAYAAPTNVSITPPDGARFMQDQKFDLRVEGQGTGPFSATLAIDGVQQNFTSGVQNSNTTDGISSTGYGGFNLRGYSNDNKGFHTITATFTDSTGTVNATAQFEIVDLKDLLNKGEPCRGR